MGVGRYIEPDMVDTVYSYTVITLARPFYFISCTSARFLLFSQLLYSLEGSDTR